MNIGEAGKDQFARKVNDAVLEKASLLGIANFLDLPVSRRLILFKGKICRTQFPV